MPTRRHLIRTATAGLGAALLGPAAAASPLRMAYFETYRPLSYLDGGIKGLLVDTLDEVVSRQLGLPCRHEGFPWPRAQALVEQGERDAICTIATPERLAYAVASEESVVVAPTCIFMLSDHPLLPRFKTAQNLAQLRAMAPSVLSYSANGWAKARLDGFNIIWGNDFMSALRMLIAGRGDIMIENALTMSYSLRQLPGGERAIALPQPMDQARFKLLVSKRSAHAAWLPQFDAAMRRFKSTPRYAQLFGRYGVAQYAQHAQASGPLRSA